MNAILCQLESQKDIDKNLNKALRILNNNDFDICIFPELYLTSYDFDYLKCLSKEQVDKALYRIQAQLNKFQTVVIGTFYDTYNAAAIITKQKILFYYKNTLTEKDNTFFEAGDELKVVNLFEYKIGFLICRDQNNLELIQSYKNKRCDIIIQLSAHFYEASESIKKMNKNIAMSIVRAIDTETLFFKVNAVGKLNNTISHGNSVIVNKDGILIRQCNQYQEEIIKFNTKGMKW